MRSVIPNNRWARAGIVLLFGVFGFIAVGASSCDTPNGQDKDATIRQGGFDRLQAQQPAVYMDYSPTRDTIKFFADTWGKDPNKLSYVYLTNQAGVVVRYYVIKGLPTSFCAQMLPPQVVDWSSSGGNVVIPAPAIDGAYYSGNAGCNQYYGRDATTNSYVSWTQETGITQVSEQPMGRPETDRAELAGGPTVIGREHQ